MIRTVGMLTKEKVQEKRQEYHESDNAVEKNLYLGENDKAELFRRADDQL